jgi:peptidoglycan hydrolase-like protein with peptidoglycan-binding domain
MSRTGRVSVVAVLVAVAVAAVAAAHGFGAGGASVQAADAPVRTADLTRMTLVDSVDVTGEIGFGEVRPLRYIAPPSAPSAPPSTAPGQQGQGSAPDGLGLVTWLPAVGTTVHRGETLFRVDERPVVLLYGSLPLYRTLASGTEGPDVAQLENNLHELGYTGFTVDQKFTDATANALRRWQKSLGVAQTGAVSPGQVLYAAGAVRVVEQRINVGDVASGEILGYSGSMPSVTAQVDPAKVEQEIKVGTPVTVIVDGAETSGTVQRVGPPPAQDGGGAGGGAGAGGSSVQVEVSVPDEKVLAGREGGVTVRFVVSERAGVLAAPVVALVALGGGGYGLQVVDGAKTRYVAVGTGLFARGYVEITSGDVTEGTKVVVPS